MHHTRGARLVLPGLFQGLIILGLAPLLFAADSPDDRRATDPKSISSPASPSARPVPIDDLFYSRRVNSPAWSPNGEEIVFTTNLTGRANLWKVSSEGGWPVQLTVSDDRQSAAAWSPDGKWIVYQQDFGGSEYYDLFAVPSSGGVRSISRTLPRSRRLTPNFHRMAGPWR